jgi:serine/threonine protein kinase
MPIQVVAQGGANYQQNIQNLSKDEATDILTRVQAHLNLRNKSSGVFVLVNRNKAGGTMELARKSGFQLWRRGEGNSRLNQTRDFWKTVLTTAGKPEAAARLEQYLNAKSAGHRNRVDVAFIQKLLQEPQPAPDANGSVVHQPDSEAPPQAAELKAKPPLAEGNTLTEVRTKAGLQMGKMLGEGAFGAVHEVTIGNDTKPSVIKTFHNGATPVLSLDRATAPKESIAAYLVSKKQPGFAQKAGVAETQFFTVSVNNKFKMVDSLGLRALIKASPEGSVKLHELVMERVPGREAFDEVAENKLSAAQRKALTQQSFQSIVILHGRNIVARDHKWENVMYDTATNKATLIDTGMFYKASKANLATRFIRNSAIGTPQYMHPRALTGQPHGRETDVYAQAIMTLVLAHTDVAGLMQATLLEPAVKAVSASGKADKYLDSQKVKSWAQDQLQSLTTRAQYNRQLAASRDAMARFVNAMDQPDSLANFGLKCLDFSNQPAAKWADRDQAMQWHEELLQHPAIA